MTTTDNSRSLQAVAYRPSQRQLLFLLFIAAFVALYFKVFCALVSLCLHGDSYSHIFLVPFIAMFLFITERKTIFDNTKTSPGLGIAVLALGLLVTITADPKFYSNGGEHLSAEVLGFVLICWGGFLAFYGAGAVRRALFPLLFLLLMVPLPDAVLSRVIAALQYGSVEVSLLLFKIFEVPVLRQGVLLTVPGVTIEVAKECSSIRSSMALFITCLLAAHFYLRSLWKQALFVLLSIPLSVIKNGIRITTLTLLSIYVNPGFLHGDLHRDGGFAFFLLALAILWPILTALHSSESHSLLSRHEISAGGTVVEK